MTATTAAVEEEKTEAEKPDFDVILPEPGEVVVGGIPCTVAHLKTREFFALMALITKALGPEMGNVAQSMDTSTAETMAGEMTGMLLMAIPLQYDSFISLVRMIVKAQNDQDAAELRLYLENPEVEDLLPIIDAVIENEKDSIWSLLGKAKAYMARWKTTFATAKADRGRGRLT